MLQSGILDMLTHPAFQVRIIALKELALIYGMGQCSRLLLYNCLVGIIFTHTVKTKHFTILFMLGLQAQET